MDIPHPFIKTIEWDMMDKRKFFPLSMLSSFSVRCCLYPLTVIKTRLQLQKHGEMYGGTVDAFKKIYAFEGIAGLYRGFWISSVQIVSGVFYISTYEGIRHMMAQKNIDCRIRALIGGGCASVVSQTIVVPFDIISQHLMVLGIIQNKTSKVQASINELGVVIEGKSWINITKELVTQIYIKDGIQGFYRGYLASLAAYVPNSAMWWAFYHFYQDEIIKISPIWISHLFVQCIAATLGGFTTTIITNPLDIIRARLQVQRTGSMAKTFHVLWTEEKLRIFTKGLSARLVQSATFSFSIILGYETIKRLSVTDEYKHHIKW
ncbi:mitochondrial glutamate carrier, putative [Pediculus humanus corporis]|uniref:Mitochondrial glutamate carrier, putative n=1 Tax=Pediculus humanus subsp. corporis TaxID=121224 RepID=E0VPH0_PEDHC|nr:mitochondrial glutamate carrier, putative [Pediculus humanus corporis]EEB15276.1 mitochondrial glutamate carrier, putative [Pediculus humanus corporis]